MVNMQHCDDSESFSSESDDESVAQICPSSKRNSNDKSSSTNHLKAEPKEKEKYNIFKVREQIKVSQFYLMRSMRSLKNVVAAPK